MDAARPEEVDVPYDPLDVVEHVLNAENLPFDRTDDGDLAFALAGDWKDYELWFAWRPEGDCLQLFEPILLLSLAQLSALVPLRRLLRIRHIRRQASERCFPR